MKTEKKVIKADPQLSTAAKLEQIKSGAKNKRTTGGGEKKILSLQEKMVPKLSNTKKKKNSKRQPFCVKRKTMLCMKPN
jgi:hypothetical protein